MTYLREILEQAVSSLLRNKLRSLLTMGGIAWGIASIVLIIAMGDGFKVGQRDRTRQMGDNIVVVFAGRTEKQAGGQRAGRRIRLTHDDMTDIATECFLVKNVVAELFSSATTVSAFNSGTFSVLGVESLYSTIRNIPLDRGRFIVQQDDDDSARVAVLGDNVRKQLFGDRTGVLGSRIYLAGLPYRVIGYMPPKDQNSSYNGLDSDKVFIPYSSLVRDLPLKDANFHPGIVSDIIYVPASVAEWSAAERQVRRVLARNHAFEADDQSAIRMWDTVKEAELTDGMFTSMTAFLGAIAVVTLSLGGVGVMNIMLVSVTERTREIGLRKAVGATRRRILVDFLIEGIMLATISGIFGWLGAYGLSSAVNLLPKREMFGGLPVHGSTTFLAFGALGLTAVLSSVWPAWRGASLTPVEALRYER
jgi:putative ABC transport system permease protein